MDLLQPNQHGKGAAGDHLPALDYFARTVVEQKCGVIRLAVMGANLRQHCPVNILLTLLQEPSTEVHSLEVGLLQGIASASLSGPAVGNCFDMFRNAVRLRSEEPIPHALWILFRDMRVSCLSQDEAGSMYHPRDYCGVHDTPRPEVIMELLALAACDRIAAFCLNAQRSLTTYFDSPPPHHIHYCPRDCRQLKAAYNWRRLLADATESMKGAEDELEDAPPSVVSSLLFVLNFTSRGQKLNQVFNNLVLLALGLHCLALRPLQDETSIADRLCVPFIYLNKSSVINDNFFQQERRIPQDPGRLFHNQKPRGSPIPRHCGFHKHPCTRGSCVSDI